MRIAVISDSHGSTSWIEKLMPVFDTVDCIIHLGDGVADAEKLKAKVKCPVYNIAGNCDMTLSVPDEFCRYIGGVKVFATHGSRYALQYDLLTLSQAAQEKEAKLCLYGHTHVPDTDCCYGIWFVNPGSIARPRGFSGRTYAIIEIDKKGEIKPDIISLD